MAAEVRIVVRQEAQGTAIKDAERDLEKLEKKQESMERSGGAASGGDGSHSGSNGGRPRSGGRGGRRISFEELERRYAQQAAPASPKQAAANEAALGKQIQMSTQLEALQARASGDTAGAAALEREAKILARSVAIRKTLNVAAKEADILARQMVENEEKLAEEKRASVEAEKAKKNAAAQTLSEEKAVLATKRQQAREDARERREKRTQEREATMVLNRGFTAAGFGGAFGGGLAGGFASTLLRAIGAAAREIISQSAKERDDAFGLHTRGVQQVNRQKRISSLLGVRGEREAAANLEEQRQALNQAIERRGTFLPQGRFDGLKRAANHFGGWFQVGEHNAEQNNEDEIARLTGSIASSELIALQKYKEGTGGLELELQRKLISGDSRDRRATLAIRDKISWWEEYDRSIQQLGKAGEAEAQERANNKVFLEQRRRQGEFGRLVNARSGAADSARAVAASFMSERVTGGGDLRGAIESLHATTKQQFAATFDPSRPFTGPTRKLNR